MMDGGIYKGVFRVNGTTVNRIITSIDVFDKLIVNMNLSCVTSNTPLK